MKTAACYEVAVGSLVGAWLADSLSDKLSVSTGESVDAVSVMPRFSTYSTAGSPMPSTTSSRPGLLRISQISHTRAVIKTMIAV